MADKTDPNPVAEADARAAPRGKVIKCDFVSGRSRWIARLAIADRPRDIAAIWRNEIGTAPVTAPRRAP